MEKTAILLPESKNLHEKRFKKFRHRKVYIVNVWMFTDVPSGR